MDWKRAIGGIMGVRTEIPPRPFVSPVFVTGCMRSGTSFLAELLGEHPGLLHLPGELNRVWTAIGGMDCIHDRNQLSSEDLSPEYIANMASYFSRCEREFTKKKYRLFRWNERRKKGSGGIKKYKDPLLINKNVHFVNRLDYLLHMFPNSRVILLVRPIEGQVNSLRLHFQAKEQEGVFHSPPRYSGDSWIADRSGGGTREWSFKDLLKVWLELNLKALQDLANFSSDRYLVIDHQRLVEAPRESILSIQEFLGLDSVPPGIGATTLERGTYNSRTGGDPVNDWKKRFSKEEKELIEKFKEDHAEEIRSIQSRFGHQ